MSKIKCNYKVKINKLLITLMEMLDEQNQNIELKIEKSILLKGFDNVQISIDKFLKHYQKNDDARLLAIEINFLIKEINDDKEINEFNIVSNNFLKKSIHYLSYIKRHYKYIQLNMSE